MRRSVAIVGCGLIGRAWAIVFARAGFGVKLWDANSDVMAIMPHEMEVTCKEVGEDPKILNNIRYCDTLEGVLQDVEWVQESGPERLEIKQAIYAELDRIAAPETVLASSSTALVASRFAAGLAGRHRILVAHPVNPPHVIPVVELCPSPDTDAKTMDTAEALMREVGQVPVRLSREIDGFILNRLQAVLLAESLRLVADGVVTAKGLDDTIAHGLGRRWTLMGPLATINLNAPGGVGDYLDRYGPTMARLADDAARGAAFGTAAREAVAAELPPPEQVPDLSRRRDERLAALAKFLKSEEGGE